MARSAAGYGVEHVTCGEIEFVGAATANSQLNRTEDSSGGTKEGAPTLASKGVNPPSGKVFTVFILFLCLVCCCHLKGGTVPVKRNAKSKATQRLRPPLPIDGRLTT